MTKTTMWVTESCFLAFCITLQLNVFLRAQNTTVTSAMKTLPSEVRQLLLAEFKEIQDDMPDLSPTEFLDGLTIRAFPATDDGRQGGFIVKSSDSCGNRTCSMWVYMKVENQWKEVLGESTTSIVPLSTFTNRHRDLKVKTFLGNSDGTAVDIYKFDGHIYRPAVCHVVNWDSQGRETTIADTCPDVSRPIDELVHSMGRGPGS
jgi:hypothetical protein